MNLKKPQKKSAEEQLEILKSGVVDLIDEKELFKKLRKSLENNRPLKVKAGFDPSRPDLHLGHTLVINKLRQFQELGHEVHFVVGDWTACIGDPTGQDKTRPILSRKQVKQQAETYIKQVTHAHSLSVVSSHNQKRISTSEPVVTKSQRFFSRSNERTNSNQTDDKLEKLLQKLQRLKSDKQLKSDEKPLKISYNSTFYKKLSKKLPDKKQTEDDLFLFVNKIASKITVDQVLNRDDFKKRLNAGKPLYLHECLYPVFQAYDSVALKADVELGGTDQLFNFLLARDLQEKFDQPPQCVLTLPLLEGLDGVQKMSKSLNNFIAFNDNPKDIYGKVMKISDDLMCRYWKILAGVELSKESINPKKEKELLAFGIVSSFHGEDVAYQAQEEFQRVFSQRKFPSQIDQKNISSRKDMWICRLIVEAELCSSTSEARRQIQGGGIKIYHKADERKERKVRFKWLRSRRKTDHKDEQGEWKEGEKLSDYTEKMNLKAGDNFLLSCGRRKFMEIKVH